MLFEQECGGGEASSCNAVRASATTGYQAGGQLQAPWDICVAVFVLLRSFLEPAPTLPESGSSFFAYVAHPKIVPAVVERLSICISFLCNYHLRLYNNELQHT